MGGVNFQSPSKKWWHRSNSENREGIDGASMLIVERPGLARRAWKTSEPLWEKPFQDQDLVASLPEGSLELLRMNYRSLR